MYNKPDMKQITFKQARRLFETGNRTFYFLYPDQKKKKSNNATTGSELKQHFRNNGSFGLKRSSIPLPVTLYNKNLWLFITDEKHAEKAVKIVENMNRKLETHPIDTYENQIPMDCISWYLYNINNELKNDGISFDALWCDNNQVPVAKMKFEKMPSLNID